MNNGRISYKGHQIYIQARKSASGYQANLELTYEASGVTYRRWWPLPHPDPFAAYPTALEAENSAREFGEKWIDAVSEGMSPQAILPSRQ